MNDIRNMMREHSTHIIWGACVAIAVLGVALAWWLLEPPCPTTIEIATGSRDGQYYAVAQEYRDVLAESGIRLKIRESAGSVENANLLRDDTSGIELAILQGGAVPHDEDDTSIVSLAGLYREPLWVFYRDEQSDWDELNYLEGRRVAIGPEGSGTRALAEMLLDENDIATGDEHGTELLPLSGQIAADALASGKIDAAMFVISPRSPVIRTLLTTPSVKLLSFRRAAAYCKHYRYLSPVVLHEGLLDFDANLPENDVQLLAPTASLVARGDMHEALAPLLIEAATRIHEQGGHLESPGEFPSPLSVDFPLAADARRYFDRGPSVFYRYLPFQWAAWADRVKMMLLPLVTLMIPLFKFAPPVYRWSIRSKIYRWYRVLREVEQHLKAAKNDADLAKLVTRLKEVEVELAEVSVPLSYMDAFYDLQSHVDFVQQRVQSRREQASASEVRVHRDAA